MPQIDLATESDTPQLCELLAILFGQEAEFSPNADVQKKGLEMIVGHPERGEILVVREGPEILGMASLLYGISTALGRKVATLEDVVVRPEHRSKGIGSALLEATTAHAERTGCARITLLTDGENLKGQRFYARHGFTKSGMLPMRRAVP